MYGDANFATAASEAEQGQRTFTVGGVLNVNDNVNMPNLDSITVFD